MRVDRGDECGWLVAGLRCEARTTPLGIDEPRPRLTWQPAGIGAAARETRWRVQVASRPELLARGRADLWDSGDVDGDSGGGVVYDGRPLRTGQRAHWRVATWNADGDIASAESWWEAGLARPEQWTARWIGRPSLGLDRDFAARLASATWVWGEPSAGGVTTFRHLFELPTGVVVRRVSLLVGTTAPCTVTVGSRVLDERATYVKEFPWLFAFDDLDDAVRTDGAPTVCVATVPARPGQPNAFLLQLRVELDDGRVLDVTTGSGWRTTNGTPRGFDQPSFDDSSWAEARAIARHGDQAASRLKLPKPAEPPAYLRTEFELPTPPLRARLFVTALGCYEAWINGARVGADHFTPGWTDYDRRLQYQVYDVTALLGEGRNALGAVLADGWFAGAIGWNAERHHWGGGYPLLLRAQLVAELDDGEFVRIDSDETWSAAPAASGPLRAADFLMGETFDARRGFDDWSEVGFDAADWGDVAVSVPRGVRLVGSACEPVRVLEDVEPIDAWSATDGVVFDFGQNLVGWVRLRLPGDALAAGDTIRVRFGEMLEGDGQRLHVANLRTARATDVYVCRGDRDVEEWEPRFTFHGFRYVHVAGLPTDCLDDRGRPPFDVVQARVASSTGPTTGAFSCSSDIVTRLWTNALWSQRGNFLEVPTDCPQRDERLGWLGDAQVFVPTALANTDVEAFLGKWLVDVADAQGPAGDYSEVAPRIVTAAAGAPAWGNAGVIVPWLLHRHGGDLRVLERHYDGMQRWFAWIADANPDGIWRQRVGNDHGDWVALDDGTSKRLIATAYHAHDADLLAHVARALGRHSDAADYAFAFERLRAAFRAAFVRERGSLASDTQTAYALALAFDLFANDDERAGAGARLATLVEQAGHATTGFVGIAHLLPALASSGRADLAYGLLLREEYPSFGYQIRHGATTIWERWDGWTEANGFQDWEMNSFNHYAFGSVVEWLYAGALGIGQAADSVGYARPHIEPMPDPLGRVRWAQGHVATPRGVVGSEWTIDDAGALRLRVTIPGSTLAATVQLPGVAVGAATLDGESLDSAGDASSGLDRRRFELAPGRYEFLVRDWRS